MYGTEDTTVPRTVVTVVGVEVLVEVLVEIVAVEGPVTEMAVEGPDVVDTSSPIGMDTTVVVVTIACVVVTG